MNTKLEEQKTTQTNSSILQNKWLVGDYCGEEKKERDFYDDRCITCGTGGTGNTLTNSKS